MITVYYDGDCGFCQEFARVCRRLDLRNRLRFERLGEPSESVIVRERNGRTLLRAEAVLRVMAELGGVWKFLGALGGLLPRGIANAAYDAVARRRRGFCTHCQRASISRPNV